MYLCFFLVSIHLNPLSTTTGGQGQGGTGRNGTGWDQRGRRQKRGTVRGGRSDRRVCPLSFFNSFCSPSHSSSFRLPFFLQSTPTGEAGWGVSDADGTTYRSHPPREVYVYSEKSFSRCCFCFSKPKLTLIALSSCVSTGDIDREMEGNISKRFCFLSMQSSNISFAGTPLAGRPCPPARLARPPPPPA